MCVCVCVCVFRAGLGISEPADGGKLVTTFPEVLGLKLEVMEGNVQVGGRGSSWAAVEGEKGMQRHSFMWRRGGVARCRCPVCRPVHILSPSLPTLCLRAHTASEREVEHEGQSAGQLYQAQAAGPGEHY